MQVRRWEVADNKRIAEMEEKYFSDPWNYKMLTETCLLPNFIGFVIFDEKGVRGYIGSTYCIDEGEITLVAVDEDVRRKGYATRLLEELENALSALGVERLLLEVRMSNYAAQKCYVKYGFTLLSIRKNYYGNTEDAIIMEKRIR